LYTSTEQGFGWDGLFVYLCALIDKDKVMTNTAQATPESVWVILRELAERQAETDRQMKETDRKMQETDRRMQETDRRIDKVSQTLGSWANNHGYFAEEYFFNSFESGKRNFFGEKFDEIRKNVHGLANKDEYDILLINGKSIGIVEVKYKAHENDVPKILKKAETFRANFPAYAGHRVYLGLATMAFYPELEQACINSGIAIVKQVGETVVINDEHLKAF
jgi:hypothetical protein